MTAITDLLDRVTDSNSGRPVVSTLAAPGKAIGASSITLSDGTNWTTSSAIHFSVYKVNAQGYKDVTTQTDWKGVLAGTTISNLTLTGGVDQAYNAGDIVELTPTARYAKDLFDTVTQDHDTQGRHKQLTDTNGNKILGANPVASAVNDVAVANAATGNAPALTAEGADPNIDLLLSGKGTGSPRYYGNYDGWALDADTWVYVSATSFKIAGKNVTARFPTGTKIKVIQSGNPAYFYVTSAAFSTDTTVNITAGSDYSLASGFTVPSYSYATSPQGFPPFFNFTPSFTGVTLGTGGVAKGYFSMSGKQLFLDAQFILGTGGSVSGGITCALPVACDTTLQNSAETTLGLGHAWFAHAGSDMYPGAVMYSSSAAVGFRYTRQNATPNAVEAPSGTNVTGTAPFTWTANDWLHWALTYKVA